MMFASKVLKQNYRRVVLVQVHCIGQRRNANLTANYLSKTYAAGGNV